MKFDQNKYISEYNKQNYKMFQFRVKKGSDIDTKISGIKNRNSYIVSLIEKDNYKKVLTLKQIKDTIIPILNKHDIYDIYLFGSYSRGEANDSSDVDIYCEKGSIKSLLDDAGLTDELEEALGKKVDLIYTTSTMNDLFKESIMEDMIKICWRKEI